MHTQHQLILFLSLLWLFQPSLAIALTAQTSGHEEQATPQATSITPHPTDANFKHIRDPFLSSLEERRMQEAQRAKQEQYSPRQSRKREALEHFDLSTLTLVATYKKSGQQWVASVQNALGQAYTVRHGNYIGRHEGHVEKIDAHTIHLIEKVLSPAGHRVERRITLTMDEVSDVFSP